MIRLPCINCDPDSGEDAIAEAVAEAKKEESTKWAKFVVALGYPSDFTNPDVVGLLDDDMIFEIAVAWHDSELPRLNVPGAAPEPPSIEEYIGLIREEIGI